MTTTPFTHGYALLIGVGDCPGYPKWSLPVTVKDARAVKSILTDPTLCGYPDTDVHVRLLSNETATKAQIVAGLQWLQQVSAADPEATIVLYYSGHGWVSDDGRYVLIPHDVDPVDFPASALAASTFIEQLRAIQAQRLLTIMDCCHAQGMATSKDGEAPPPVKLPTGYAKSALPDALTQTLRQGEGRAVLLSSKGAQRSYIRPDQTLSIFSDHLIEALRGAGNQPGETEVRLSNLMNYLGRTVPQSAKAIFNTEQEPIFDAVTTDFPVALVHGGSGFVKGAGWASVDPVARIPGVAYSKTINVGDQGVVVEGNAQDIFTGDNARKIQAETYIENQYDKRG